jgi:hypothetical protein
MGVFCVYVVLFTVYVSGTAIIGLFLVLCFSFIKQKIGH